jgi:hypothetical protein
MQEQTDTSSVTETPKMAFHFRATVLRSQPAAKYMKIAGELAKSLS